MGDTLSRLIAEGVVVLYHDYRSGSFHDFSGQGNDGTPTDVGFQGGGLRLIDTDGEVLVADAPELQLTALTVVMFGDFSQHARLTSSSYIVSKRDAGGTNYAIKAKTGPDGMNYWDGAANKTLNCDLVTAKCAAVGVANGEAAEGFLNGLSVGAFSGVSAVAVNDAPLYIGNIYTGVYGFGGILDAVIICNRKLTAPEHAALYSELVNKSWPSKPYTQILRPQRCDPTDTTLTGGWGGSVEAGVVVDAGTGGNDGTPTDVSASQTLYGSVLNYNGDTSRMDLGAVDVIGTGDVTFSCWMYPLSWGGANYGRIFDNGKFLVLVHFSSTSVAVYSNGSTRANSATGSLVPNRLHHFAVTRTSGGVANIYINGELSGDANQGTGTPTAGTVNSYIGNDDPLTHGFDGWISKVQVHSEIKSTDWIQDQYKDGASAMFFKADYGVVESAANQTDGFLGDGTSPIIVRSGTFVMGNDTIDGVSVKVIECVADGNLRILAGNVAPTPKDLPYGTTEWWAFHDSSSTLTFKLFNSSLDKHEIVMLSNGELRLQRKVGGGATTSPIKTATGFITADTWYKLRVTRTDGDVVSIYVNDVLAPVTTGTNPMALGGGATEGTSMDMNMDAGDKIAWADLRGEHSLKKLAGVVAP